MESSLRSGRYPSLSTLAEQDTAPNNSNNHRYYTSGSNNNGSNNHSKMRDTPKPVAAFIESLATQLNLAGQPAPSQVVYTLAPAPAPTP